jgi:hypothetical protein
MTKITPQEISRWSAWIIKAKKLKNKYENLKNNIFSDLIKIKPSFFGQYDYKRSLILLFLLLRVTNTQEMLYIRFVNGSKIFLSGIGNKGNKTNFSLLESVHLEGELLLKEIKKERKSLVAISEYFEGIDKSISKGIISSGSLNEQMIKQAQERIANIPKKEIKRIKLAHQLAIKGIHKEEKIQQQNKGLDELKMMVMGVIENKKFVMGANIVYVAGYLGFWTGILDYQIFNEVTNLARRSIAVGSNNPGLAF